MDVIKRQMWKLLEIEGLCTNNFVLDKNKNNINWKEEQERRNQSWGLEEEWLQKREMRKARLLGALTTAEHLWASCATRHHTAPQTRPPPWGRSSRTPRSRAQSPGGRTCAGQTWCCWVSQSARLPPLPAEIKQHTERHSAERWWWWFWKGVINCKILQYFLKLQ